MKKILIFSLALCMILSISVYAAPMEEIEEYAAMDFRYNANGVITDYYGESDYIQIPAEIDGTAITAVGEYAFAGRNVKSVFIEEGIQTIGKGCFEETDIEDIDLPQTLTYISDNAFANCKKLTSVWINSYNFEIADAAFSGTGFVEFCIHCSLTDQADDMIQKAKGDSNYRLQL